MDSTKKAGGGTGASSRAAAVPGGAAGPQVPAKRKATGDDGETSVDASNGGAGEARLHTAASRGNDAVATDIEAKDSNGETSLDAACQGMQDETSVHHPLRGHIDLASLAHSDLNNEENNDHEQVRLGLSNTNTCVFVNAHWFVRPRHGLNRLSLRLFVWLTWWHMHLPLFDCEYIFDQPSTGELSGEDEDEGGNRKRQGRAEPPCRRSARANRPQSYAET